MLEMLSLYQLIFWFNVFIKTPTRITMSSQKPIDKIFTNDIGSRLYCGYFYQWRSQDLILGGR